MTDPFMQPDSGPIPGDIVGGRYQLPHPVTGEPASWSRTTNFIKKLDDTYALEAWDKRQLLIGLALREDLYAEACTLSDGGDTKALDRLADVARDAAGANHGRRVGSALHKFTERLNRGEPTRVPSRWRNKVELYAEAIGAHHLRIVPELIERTVVNLTYDCAGTFDNGLLTLEDLLVIGDLKSQKKIYGYGSPACQFGMYANSDAMWNPETGTYEEMPPFSKDVALMLWLPVAEDRCEVHEVDIGNGWAKLELAKQVRDWQNEAKRKGAVGRPLAPPSKMAVTEAYARRIKEAGTREELRALWVELGSHDLQVSELLSLVRGRLEEFETPA